VRNYYNPAGDLLAHSLGPRLLSILLVAAGFVADPPLSSLGGCPSLDLRLLLPADSSASTTTSAYECRPLPAITCSLLWELPQLGWLVAESLASSTLVAFFSASCCHPTPACSTFVDDPQPATSFTTQPTSKAYDQLLCHVQQHTWPYTVRRLYSPYDYTFPFFFKNFFFFYPADLQK
jgi:hypothetical protein